MGKLIFSDRTVSYTHLDVYKRQALLSEEMSPKHCYQALKKYFFRTDKIVRTSQQIT